MQRLKVCAGAMVALVASACGSDHETSGGNGAGAAPSGVAGSSAAGGLATGGAANGGAASGGGGASSAGTAGTGAEAGSAGAAGAAGSCVVEPVTATCPDEIEGDVSTQCEVTLEVDAPTTLSEVLGMSGATALRLDTEAGFLVTLRFTPGAPLDASGKDELRLLVRASNTNSGWQGAVPAVTFEDAAGLRRTYTPSGPQYPSDGATWVELRIPLAGGGGYTATGDAVDWSQIAAFEFTADTWESGFVIDFDGLGFVGAGTVCAVDCPDDCNGRGVCDARALGCVCEVGAVEPDCQTCRDGFSLDAGHCTLDDDGDFDEWPNAVSKVNGDAWLAVHHQSIRQLHPRVLALNFVNPSDPSAVATLVDDVIAGFREGSRALGYANDQVEPALDYDLVDIVDLRDGVDGRDPAPVDYAYENSTLFPRRPNGESGAWSFDYKQLFSAEFAPYYGFEDPDAPGTYLTLCELIESGDLHELWIVGSGDVPDVAAAEVLEFKQRYDRSRNPIDGEFDGCAGNGCFDADVPHCARSVRIGFVNYNRGPGCYLHSQGHGLESTGTRSVIPALSEWFVPFAGFDLDQRWGLPAQSFYGLFGDANYASYPAPDTLVAHRDGGQQSISPYVASCGNVHFPPNAGNHYDYSSTTPVDSECADFGRNVLECRERAVAAVTADDWADYETLSPDCGGAFLVWWYQNMPGFASNQFFDDARPMPSVWPFWFY